MGTPFISLLEPTRLDGYDRTQPHTSQPPHIPQVFLDAMSVREAVFVGEQAVALENEFDADDARSCHWVAYASVSQKGTVPIGTLRIVPFPHLPHPPAGGRYIGGVLQDPTSDSQANQDSSKPATTTTNPSSTASITTTQDPLEAQSTFGHDRPTTYHDGREPYVKLTRVAVIAEFRGHRIAGQLWRAARAWLEAHPSFFDPSVAELGMDRLAAGAASEIPRWAGLVGCHAQESVTGLYERWGFRVDEGMGRFFEEDIPHVGMFQRLSVKEETPKV
ncbi:hypothetical protein GGR54DRAFT_3022 [Hypoxylon sp. NC1633]|nr:hypothetical protein GGR54DRAFT_3022 [Hypoxylon sp. NC1633]